MRHALPKAPKAFRALLVTGALGTFMGTFAAPSLADDNFDVSVAAGQVTVTAKGSWHVNAEYPWSLAVAGSKLDKTKFAFAEKTAVVSGAPSGTGVLRGGVCGEGKCRSFVQSVTIP